MSLANSTISPPIFSSNILVGPLSQNDTFSLEAGASKRIVFLQLIINNVGSQTTAGFRTISLIRLTSASSGGGAVTANPYDNTSSFSGRLVTIPTTKGTGGNTLYNWGLFVPSTATVQVPYVYNFSPGILIPAGTSNGIALRDNGATGAANFSCVFTFAEIT